MTISIFRPHWEIIIADEVVTTAKRLYTNTLDPIDAHYEKIRKRIAIYRNENRAYLRCSHCRTPLFAKQYKNADSIQYGLAHHGGLSPNPEIMATCPYYTNESHFSSLCSKKESTWRTESKYSVYDQLKQDPQVNQESIKISKFIFSQDNDESIYRKPDLSFSDRYGNLFAIEFYRSWINPQIAHEREIFFRNQGINLLWLFPNDRTEDFVKNSQSMKHHIMYGQFYSDSNIIKFSTTSVPSNNVFCYDPLEETGDTFLFDCIYPVYHITNPENFPAITTTAEYCHQKVALKDLSLDPFHRLPIAIDTSSNQRLQRDLIAQLTNEFRRVYRQTIAMKTITANDFNFVSKILVNKIYQAEQLTPYLSNPKAQNRLTSIIQVLALFQEKAIVTIQRLQHRLTNKGARENIAVTLRKLRTLAQSTGATSPSNSELTNDFLDAASIDCLALSPKAKKRGLALIYSLRNRVSNKALENNKDKYHISKIRENFEYKPDLTRSIDPDNITLADCYLALRPVLDAEKVIDRILYNTEHDHSLFERNWPDIEALIKKVNPSLMTLLLADLSKYPIDDAYKFRYARNDLEEAIKQFRSKRDLQISRNSHSQNNNQRSKISSAYSKIRG